MEPPQARRAPDGQPCLVCGEPAPLDTPLCSRKCRTEAGQELAANTACMRQRRVTRANRASLATRNGMLTSALVRWSA